MQKIPSPLYKRVFIFVFLLCSCSGNTGSVSLSNLSPEPSIEMIAERIAASTTAQFNVTIEAAMNQALTATQQPVIEANQTHVDKIAFVKDCDIYTVNVDGSESNLLYDIQSSTQLCEETFENNALFRPVWSPDNTMLAFGNLVGNTRGITIINADGLSPRMITSTSGFDVVYDWSSDGRQLIFMRTSSSFRGICVLQIDNPSIEICTDEYVGTPSWFNDDNDILIGGNGRSGFTITDARFESEQPLFTEEQVRASLPLQQFQSHGSVSALSPSGDAVVFEINLKLYQADITSGEVQDLLPTELLGLYPDYSWDGSRIAFTCGRSGDINVSLCIINSDGSHLMQLTQVQGYVLVWSN